VHGKFKQLLHDYKREVFQLAHHQKDVESITAECVHITEDVLQQHYRYHFHKLPDANRAEIINMISNYVREAVLPPVVRKMAERHVVLERRVEALEKLLAASLELLSEPQAMQGARK
jgi:demethoxyubiquinone hydroxylase (CLK1/Coq7/Cat5 family)